MTEPEMFALAASAMGGMWASALFVAPKARKAASLMARGGALAGTASAVLACFAVPVYLAPVALIGQLLTVGMAYTELERRLV